MTIITTRLGLARALWFYGEDELWPRARTMSLPDLAKLGTRAGELYTEDTQRWLGRRLDGTVALVLAATEVFEGKLRPPSRTRRRPEKQMPAELVATEEQRWTDPELSQLHRMAHGQPPDDPAG